MKLLFVTLIIIFANTVAAADITHTSTLHSIDQQENGDLVLRFNTDHAACTNGNNPKYYYVRVDQAGVSSDTYKSIFSMAMSAGIAKKTVSFVFNDATNACWVNRFIVNF